MTTTVSDLEAPGMGPVLGPGPGIGGQLKSDPDDFHVEEIPIRPPPAEGPGKWTVATVRTRGWETHDLARELAGKLGVDPDAVHFAGTKDKQAVTTQMLAVQAPVEAVEELSLDAVEVVDAYRSNRAPKIGELHGNRFRIVVRDVADDVDERLAARVEAIEARGGVPDYFGPQRFGTIRPVTHRVGEAIVRDDVREAVLWYVGHPFEEEADDAIEARTLADEERFEEALSAMPRPFGNERRMLEHLVAEPGDWVGAYRTLPHRLQQLIVYAYQSELFNRVLARRIEAGLPVDEPVVGDLVCDVSEAGMPDTDRLFTVHEGNLETVVDRVRAGKAWVTGPLLGTRTPLARGEPGEIERAVLDEADLSPPDFRLPKLPDLSPAGIRRTLLCPVQSLEAERVDDRVEVAFSLPKGSYATCVLREIMA